LEGYTVTIKPTPWKRGLKELEDGTAFALFPPYYHPEKRPFIKPYSKPILTESVVCFCNKSAMANPRPKWPEDYFGLTIGKNAGFEIGGDAFNNAAKEGKIKVVEGKSNESNLLMMAKGRADCYVNDRLSILTELSRLEKSGAITADERVNYVEAVLINEEKGFLGFTDRDQGKFTFKDDFVKKLDQILDEMQKNGEIDKIVQNAIK
jgi:polar amino acid transport system substrate-binding protein